MSLEDFSKKFKSIITEEGARKIFPLNIEKATDYIDKSIQSYKNLISSNLNDVIFTLFKKEEKLYVLIIDPNEGKNYIYDCESETITLQT
ncbi:MAG: hypothetical protein NC935_03785 [Candidatus Omnitrophica bacterium]|nr:hypothetical protein [Candidatus Omnitrophota bacterium]